MPIQEIRLHNEAAKEVKGLGVDSKCCICKGDLSANKIFSFSSTKKQKQNINKKQIHQRVKRGQISNSRMTSVI